MDLLRLNLVETVGEEVNRTDCKILVLDHVSGYSNPVKQCYEWQKRHMSVRRWTV